MSQLLIVARSLPAVLLVSLGSFWACSSNRVPGDPPCQTSDECQADQICLQGACRPKCLTSADCQSDRTCVNGACLLNCIDDSDCPAKEACKGGICQLKPDDPDGGCQDGGTCGCIDRDGDGYGENCALGPDCNDSNPSIHPNAEEICGDSVDNDCDGQTDESCPCQPGTQRLCSSFADPLKITVEMICRPGLQFCNNGEWAAECLGEVGPQAETCNGLDDNCDGRIDEGLRNAVGECADVSQVPPEDCGPTGEGNGLDDNGDGQVDEGCNCAVPGGNPDLERKHQPCYSGPIYTLGVGICHGGFHDCVGGAWQPCLEEQAPMEEVCGDLLDNDCDGLIDETCPLCTPTNNGIEICDDVDNNCDGVIDEGVRNRCGGCGPVPDQEICGDGLDNNCNGIIDDGCMNGCSGGGNRPCYGGPPQTAGVGECRMGIQDCDGEFWGVCRDFVLPAMESCGTDGVGNGKDDDCDGLTDEGCGCVDGSQQPCGSNTGACRYGAQTCAGHQWGECTGGIGPSTEICDDVDNDCDGLTSEGLLNACGKCNEPCYMHPVDPTTEGTPDQGIMTVEGNDPENPTGRPGITLSHNSFIPPYLWAANHGQDSVSKVNTNTAVEEGRYWVGNNPSRTAVDTDGNMWVGTRGEDATDPNTPLNNGRLTKILWDASSCPDRNNNQAIDTSSGGTIVNSEADPLADECVVCSFVPDPTRASIRGIAAAPDGRIWVGYTAGGVQVFDRETCAPGTFYPGTGVAQWRPDGNGVQQPTGATRSTGGVYGLVVDSQGFLYTSSYTRNSLAKFNTNLGQEGWVAVYEGLCGSYGIAVGDFDRIWLGSWGVADGSGNHPCTGVGMFDPRQNRFYTFAVPFDATHPLPLPGETSGVTLLSGDVYTQVVTNGAFAGYTNYQTTGVGVEPATGNVWSSFFPIGYTGRLIVNEADYSLSQWVFIPTARDETTNILLPGVGVDLRGVGFDGKGFAWTLGLGSDRVLKIDPATNRRSADLSIGQPIGPGSHYTYSDFTGSTALSFTAPRGFWTYLFAAQFDNAQIDGILWEAYVPAGTTAGIRIRTVDDNGAPLSGWLPPDNGGVPNYFDYPSGATQQRIDLLSNGGPLIGRNFEVEVRMTTNDRNVRPVVFDVQLEWQRP